MILSLFQKMKVTHKEISALNNEHNQLQIMRSIKEDVSQPAMAKEIGFSIGKVNFILKALIEKGWVKTERFIASNQKMKYRYLLTEEGIKEKMSLTQKFIDCKRMEYEVLQKELKEDEEKWEGVKVNDNEQHKKV